MFANSVQPRTWLTINEAACTAYAYQMTGSDTRVKVTTASGDALVITLPSVSEAEGRGLYVIKSVDHGAEDFTVVSKEVDGGGVVYTSAALTASGDFLMLWTDGETWYEVRELTTP
jgi:hypothetical protein